MNEHGQHRDARGPGARRGGERGPSRGGPRRPGDRDRRGRSFDRPTSGKAAAEHAILTVLHDLERPLTTGDYEAQRGHFAKILEKVKALRLKSLEDLDFDCRTRLFTALLRGGRQAAATVPAEEPEEARKAREAKEAQRKVVMGLLGDIWKTAGDEARAGKLYAESGRSTSALKLLEATGEWQDAAALHRREGRPLEAARLYEQHEAWANALACFKEAKDVKGWLRAALKAGDLDEARLAAKELPLKAARDVLMRARQGDLYLQLLAEKGEWNEIGLLYERAEQWSDAAMAFEKAGKLVRAAESYSKANDLVSSARCLDREVKARTERNDLVGAGEVLMKAGQVDRAIEIVGTTRPVVAFQWLQKAGLDAKALEYARARARDLEKKPAEAAIWLERAGELPLAAQAFLDGGKPAEAARVWESLQDWERAGEAAARAGQREHALELLRRAGLPDAEERAQKLLPAPPPPPPPTPASEEAPPPEPETPPETPPAAG